MCSGYTFNKKAGEEGENKESFHAAVEKFNQKWQCPFSPSFTSLSFSFLYAE